MSLDWNISKVSDWEAKKAGEFNASLLDCIIWGDLTVNMGGIPKTDKGLEEANFRYRMLDQVGIYLIHYEKDGEVVHRNVTFEELEVWQGLTTNVEPMTRKKFESYLIKRIVREATDALRYAKKKSAAES